MSDDGELLRRYVEQNSEQAFAELVNRHLGLVYYAALRQTGGNAHCAQDVAQTVFVDLARKAKSLRNRPVLAGWLYTSTRYAASKLVRSEQRRQAREEDAQLIDEISANSSSSGDGNQLRTFIDDALYALSERDREAVLLRFFEGKAFAEVGAKLSVSEDAARVRVDRALDKLRTSLSRRGLTSTSVALAALLVNEARASAPPGLAVKITGTALAGAAATAGGVAAAGTFLGLTQLQFVLAVGVALGGGGFVLHQQQQEIALRGEITELREQQNQLVHLRQQEDQRPLTNPTAPRSRIQSSMTELIQARAELALLQEKKKEIEADQAQSAEKNPPVDPAPAEKTSESRIYRPSELDERPLPLAMVEPDLTPELRRQGGRATVEFIVDATGTPRNWKVLDASSPEFGRRALAATTKWKFRPGVAKGKAVATRLTVPFRMEPKGLESTGSIYLPSEVHERPVPLSIVEPSLTPELKQEGGRATLEFVIDPTGTPTRIKVMDTSNPRFARSALAAVGKWKFKPGMVKGEPVATRLTVPLKMNSEESKARTLAQVEASLREDSVGAKNDLDGKLTPSLDKENADVVSTGQPIMQIYAPSELDEPPVPLAILMPELIPELPRHGSQDNLIATVELVIDPRGIPCLLKLLGTSNPAFGRNALAAIAKWKFRPGVVGGKPVATRLTAPFRLADRDGQGAVSLEAAEIKVTL